MIYRSIAPLRLGLAGGGTDVAPYSDLYGGATLNATISMYARATIKPLAGDRIVVRAADRDQEVVFEGRGEMPLDGTMDLVKGVYNRVVRSWGPPAEGFELTTYLDAPPGSGLGSSSTLVVAVLGAFVEWLRLPLGDYEVAHLAYSIEREDLGLEGGKQDQYAATFGGVNYMEFSADDKVVVNPLRIKPRWLHELENNLVLYHTGTSRLSSDIIRGQRQNVVENNRDSVEAMHHLRDQAVRMKEALLRGEIDKIGEILHYGWSHKKRMAAGITNPEIERVYDVALANGASGGKISGAGGGGFMILYAPYTANHRLARALTTLGGTVFRYNFVDHGLITWGI